jgi:hypothetical protein
MSNASERLEGLLGFNPSKREPVGALLSEVLDEIKKERAAEAKVEAKAALLEAMQHAKSLAEQRKKFEQEAAKTERLIAKILNRFQGQGGDEESGENAEKEAVSA